MDFSSYSVQAITRCRPLTPIPGSSSSSDENKKKNQSLLPRTNTSVSSSLLLSSSSSPPPHEQVLGCTADASTSTATSTSYTRLQRTLGLWDVIFYGVGCSVGAGIYSLVGIGADLAGPSIALSFFLCGMACCCTSLSYAEFAARVPLAGSAYTFTYVSFGELCAWLVGWNLTLGYAISAAVVARSWAEYLVGFLQGLPFFKEHHDREDGSSSGGSSMINLQVLTKLAISLPFFKNDDDDEEYTCCPLSMLIIGLCTVILVTGVKESTRFNTAMTVLNLSILLFVLLAGIGTGSVQPSQNLLPFFPHGMAGMARGAGLVFFSYLGFDMVACLSEECINPERNMPIGIVGSLAVSMTIYVSVSLVVVGMAPVHLLGHDTPIVNVLLANACCTPAQQQLQLLPSDTEDSFSCLSYADCGTTTTPLLHPILYVGSRLVSFGAIFGLTTATFACLMGQPRINFAAAKDGLLFPIFAKVHPKTGVPTIGTIITGVLTALAACFIDLESLANAISLGTLQVFSFVNAGVILLRLRGSTTTSNNNNKTTSIEKESDEEKEESTYPAAIQSTPGNISHDVLLDESTPLMTVAQQLQSSPFSAPLLMLREPKAIATARSLGLINKSSREIRQLVVQQEQQQDSYRNVKTSTTTDGTLYNTTPPATSSTTTTTNTTTTTIPTMRNEEQSPNKNNQHAIIGVVVFTLSSIGVALGLSNDGQLWIVLSCACLTGISAVVIYHQDFASALPPRTFQCPFVPTIPLLGILCNSYMMGSMPLQTWWVILMWLLVGLLFYLVYGIHHSELRHPKKKTIYS
jgi:basic amino acid/polyamine antiporter, APA family